MPISLENSSNIRVTYNTGSNYVIETVKSDLYVRGTTSGNLSSEPTVSPSIRTADVVVETFTYTTGTTQTNHTKTFSQDTICDILIIAGGGGGGNSLSGGGGAGGMVIVSGVSLSGLYTINVGKGGIKGFSVEDGESDGKNSEIFSGTDYNTSTNKIRVIGGGGGGHMFDDSAFDNGNNGGCGGGGKTAVRTTTTISLGGNITPAVKSGIFSSGVSYGNAGGNGSLQQIANNEGSGGGGGCGIGKVGGTGLYRASADTSVSLGGKGGDGLYVGDLFGTNIGVSGWIGGGGGGGSFAGGLSFSSFQDNTGGQGGGGRGGRNYSGGVQPAVDGVNGTGGGGGGGSYVQQGGNGGSGIVIIRYRSLATAPTSVNMVKTLNFNYYSSLSPTIYTLTFNTRTLATINNGSDKLLNGSYTITLGNTLSTIVPTTANQILEDTKYSSSTISVSYHLLNPILDSRGAQWTYNASNPNVYHLGSVGIGTTSPEYSLDVRGNIFTSVGGYTQTGTENWIIQSDRRIKENIVKASYEKCLENVKKIELYNFNFKENYVNTNDRNQLGFIAQEIQEVYPKAVVVKPDGRIEDLLTVNTTQIKYTLYGAVKSLIDKVENLEMRVDKLYKIAIPDVDIIEIFESTSNISIITSNLTTNSSNIIR